MATRDLNPSRRKRDYEPDEGRPLRILAVDDDPSYLRRLRLILTRSGFEVDLCFDPAEAVERMRSERDLDVLLVDYSMPQMDGIETVRRARAACNLPGLYTILLTATDGTDIKLRALESGFDDFMSKRWSDSEIVAKLRSAARRLTMERRLRVENEALQTLALTDELTGIANRRALFREAEELLRDGRSLSVVLFDLDRFKQINDTYGHLMGDRILTGVAAALKEHTRVGDVIARYGGDEFVLLLPNTPLDDAQALADRLALILRDLRWSVADVAVSISAACGVACGSGDLLALLARCDERMYRKKVRAASPELRDQPAI
ncbi:MAG TPA: diguanylate cyclase [Thermoanaerobaculia bacterium]|nr:diguanylate cyclase [Thermoanaerobaculia bacterium]